VILKKNWQVADLHVIGPDLHSVVHTFWKENFGPFMSRFQTWISRVSDATDGYEWSDLMYLVILLLLSKFKWFWSVLG
jgi:hypothetical protein